MKTPLIAVLVALCTSLSLANIATASESPLYRAADEYRDAVLDFEREVFRSRHFGRDAERLADALEDASGRLRTAARRCEDVGRLLNEWNDIQCLMPRVEAVVFGGPPCQDTAVLEFRWAHVQRTAAFVGQYIDAIQPVVVGRPPIYGHGQSHGHGGFHESPFFDPRPIPAPVPVQPSRDPVYYRGGSFPSNAIRPDRTFDGFPREVGSSRVDISRLVLGLMDAAIRSQQPSARLQREVSPSSVRAARAPFTGASISGTQVGARLQRRID